MSDLLLEATGVAKRYGAVAALRDASLSIVPGEIHALMGANGAGKSTLVKILNGAVRADTGTIRISGEERRIRSPLEARRAGIASVYQEPALIPDLDVAANLRLTDTPIEAFRRWMGELGIPDIDMNAYARDLPLPTMRVADLARALAVEPRLLMLDEMTAALPADLTERVMDVLRAQRDAGRAILFISHRLIEIRALCDRTTVLRDGETVGVEIVGEGSEEKLVRLMLGPVATELARVEAAAGSPEAGPAAAPDRPVRVSVRQVAHVTKLEDVSFDLHAGEVLGIVALEGQGQDELFAVLSGDERPTSGEILVDGQPVTFGHPSDAIGRGLAFVPANRAEAILPQRSIRENIALPSVARVRAWGAIRMGAEARRVGDAVQRLQIDTRAAAEVRRLSGGNQQKVTIARWIASGVPILLCFDPTRGIDIGTKREIYQLLRELAAGGAAVLLYTSELEEIQLACDRAVVIFRGRVVEEIPAAEADERRLLRAAYGLTGDESAEIPELAALAALATDEAGAG